MNKPKDQIDAIRAILDAVIDAVTASGEQGVSGGTLYASLMGMGCDLRTFEKLMGILVRAGRVRKSGHFYHATPQPSSARTKAGRDGYAR